MSAAASGALSRRTFRLITEVGNVLEREGATRCRILAGVSGGGDSMALLEIVSELAPRLALEVEVACADHGLRAEAAGEQALVEQACRRRGLPFHLLRVLPRDASEDACRHVRREALAGLAKERGCRWIVLAHTADDQIETVLMRFLRGAGLGGLTAMSTVSGPILRPLLALRREELRLFLQERGCPWAEDPSNLSRRYVRGRLRTLVLPALELAFGKGALTHLLESVRHWRRDHLYLEREATRVEAWCTRRGAGGGPELDLIALAEADEALRARVLHRWLGKVAAAPVTDASYVEQLLELVARGHSQVGLDLPGVRVWCENHRLRSSRSGPD